MSTHTVKIEDINHFNCVINKLKKGFKTTFFSFLAAAFIFAVLFIYFTQSAYARQAKSVSSSSQAVHSVSDYGGGLDFGYGYKDKTEARKRPFAKSGAARYKSSYASGNNSLHAHLASAIILFCTFVIISIMGIVHYLNIKLSTKNRLNSSLTTVSASSFNLSPISVTSSLLVPDASFSSVSALSSPAGASGLTSGAKQSEIGTQDLYRLYERVKEVFKCVQRSWSERELSSAEKYMSRRFFYRQQRRIEDITAKGERNIIANVEIIDVKIIEIKNDDVSGAGYMKALIKFSMIDYTVNESGGSVVKGDEYVPVEYAEVWSFVCVDNGWVVDELLSALS